MLDNLIFPSNSILSGNSGCGKSTLMTKILKQNIHNFDYIVILSPTIDLLSGDFKEFEENEDPKRGRVIQKFSNVKVFKQVIDDIVEQQEQIIKNHPKKDVPSICLILDDCIHLKMMGQHGFVNKFSTKNRHYNISMFILLQKYKGAGRTLRLNCRYLYFFNATNLSELQQVLEECVCKSQRKQFSKEVENFFTIPYTFILCHNFATNLKDRLWLNGKENIYQMLNNV